MSIPRFELERYFARHEFTARDLLACSDCEPMAMDALLAMADDSDAGRWRDLSLGYTESLGHPELRDAIAATYEGIERSQVLVAAPEECIFLTMNSLLSPGDHVVVTFPGYQSLYEIARTIGCEVSLWEPDEADGWSFRVEGLSRLLRPTTRLVVANFPHNPTGSLPTRDAFVSMISCIREIGAYFLSDEMYRGLEFDADRTLPAACDEYDRALSLSGLSKAYGLAGLRLGWLASQDAAALKRIAEMKDYTTICSSAPSEVLGIIALRNREAIVEAQRERLASNLGRLDTFFRDFSDCLQWQRPSAGSIGFPRVLCAENTDAFCEEAVDEAGVLLAPSSIFAYGVHHIRIGYGRANLPEVLEQFEHWLRTQYRKSGG